MMKKSLLLISLLSLTSCISSNVNNSSTTSNSELTSSIQSSTFSSASILTSENNSYFESQSSTLNNSFEVTFKNDDAIIDVIKVKDNESLIYKGSIPTKTSNDPNYTYDFIGWDKDLNSIRNDTIVKASYQLIKENSEFDDQDYTYREIYDESKILIGYEIRFYNNFEFSKSLVLPTKYNNLPILRIGEGCFMNTLIEEVIIPESVKVIDAYAFNTCENLKRIEFSKDTKVLHHAAIYCDPNLEHIDLNNIEFIDIDNFHLCPKLNALLVNKNNPNFSVENNILYFKDYSLLIKAPENIASILINEKTTELKEESLSRLNLVEEVIIPKGIKSIPKKLFFEAKIKKVIIKCNVNIIEERTFDHCTLLEEIVLPDTIEEIKNHAFYHCESLSKINFPSNLLTIGDFSFAYCFSLKEFNVPASLNAIGYGALDEQSSLIRFVVDPNNKYYSIYKDCLYTKDYQELIRVPETKESIEFHNALKVIGSGAMYKCRNIKELTLANIIEIKDYAFYFMDNIHMLNLPDSINKIEEGAFQNMEKLISVHLPNNLTIIEKALFANCPLLQEVNVPYGVIEIKDEAFYNCTNLPTLTLSKNVKSFGKYTFSACDMLDLINYEGSESDWRKIANRDISGLTSETQIVYNYKIV